MVAFDSATYDFLLVIYDDSRSNWNRCGVISGYDPQNHDPTKNRKKLQIVVKCIQAKIPREQFPRSILVANVMRLSLTCHEEIGRVGRVGRG